MAEGKTLAGEKEWKEAAEWEIPNQSTAKMTEITSAMDIDVDENLPRKPSNKGKDVSGFVAPPQSKTTPWVEKYRPQSLDDVAAHRDIVDTSNWTYSPLSLSFQFHHLGFLKIESFYKKKKIWVFF